MNEQKLGLLYIIIILIEKNFHILTRLLPLLIKDP